MITSCSSFGLYFSDSDEKLESHSMTKPYALSLGVTGKRMKKTLLKKKKRKRKRHFCNEVNHIYLLKWHFYYICNKSENMVEKTFHVLIDLSDELAVVRIKNLKNTKLYMLVFGMLRNRV